MALQRTRDSRSTHKQRAQVELPELDGVELFAEDSVLAGFDSVAAGFDSLVFASEEPADSPAGLSAELDPPAAFGA
jgi:hypothetical protein